MGLFRKKEDRVYPLKEAMEILKNPKYRNYTTLPVENGFKIVHVQKASEHIKKHKDIEKYNNKRAEFLDRNIFEINNKLVEPKNYNNYQNAKRYQEYR